MSKTPLNPSKPILALDVGEKRIGIAVASPVTRLPRPLATYDVTDDTLPKIAELVRNEDAQLVVVGLPRGLEGQTTAQTERIRDFAQSLEAALSVPILFQDEALTSVKAEEELQARGKGYTKHDIDSLAATYILEDYLHTYETTK